MSKALTRAQLHVVNAVQGRVEDRKERGATMVEYGLMLALIAIVCIGAVTAIGTSLRDTIFQPVADTLGGIVGN